MRHGVPASWAAVAAEEHCGGDGGRRSDVELDMDIELEMKISSRLQAAVGVEAKGAGEG